MKNVLKFSDFESRNLKEEAEGAMYLEKLQSIFDNVEKLMQIISDNEDLEAWVQDKITIAEHNIEAILGYYKSNKKGTDGKDPQPKSAEMIPPAKKTMGKLLFDKK